MALDREAAAVELGEGRDAVYWGREQLCRFTYGGRHGLEWYWVDDAYMHGIGLCPCILHVYLYHKNSI